jgi:K+-transporting ATPase ATPase A chain
MSFENLVQAAALLALVLLAAKPLGAYLARVYAGERVALDALLGPVERLVYRLGGVDPAAQMDWKRYSAATLIFNGACFAGLLGLLRCQHLLPLNPERLPAFAWPLALNTAVSFTTNTNWQNYAGETAASYFTQMVGFTVHNFVSAASGIAVAIALIRGFVRRRTAAIGNFWADLVRGTLYVLLPLSFVAALALVSQGVIQNVSPYLNATLLQPATREQPQLDEREIGRAHV